MDFIPRDGKCSELSCFLYKYFVSYFLSTASLRSIDSIDDLSQWVAFTLHAKESEGKKQKSFSKKMDWFTITKSQSHYRKIKALNMEK